VARSDIRAPGIISSPDPLPGRPTGRWPSTWGVALVATLLTLIGIALGAMVREAREPGRPPSPVVASNPFAPPPRPALAPAEEAYARALWKIHNDVKLGAVRITFAGLAYKTGEIDRATLRARVDATRDVWARAEARVRQLQPPPSLVNVHAKYLAAVRLYRQSAAEMARVATDGREQHLVAAYPLSETASKTLLEVGDALWPGEYVPN
jgi:hypothetical protein